MKPRMGNTHRRKNKALLARFEGCRPCCACYRGPKGLCTSELTHGCIFMPPVQELKISLENNEVTDEGEKKRENNNRTTIKSSVFQYLLFLHQEQPFSGCLIDIQT
jgi:hypothetical protein